MTNYTRTPTDVAKPAMNAPPWTASPGAVETFARFCAPTVVAALFGVPRREAAELLLSVPRMPYHRKGSVSTVRWYRWLKDDIGGESVPRYRLWEAHPSDDRYPTVAQFGRAFPEGTYVLSVREHTLLMKDGEVIADTMVTSSKRARVIEAIAMHDDAVGLPPAAREEWESAKAAHKIRLGDV